MNGTAVSGPLLPPDLLERVLARLGIDVRPDVDLAGLSTVYAAFSACVPSLDSIRKRVWFAGERQGPLPGGEPVDYFEGWLAHGTGGTCWPTNGAVCTLLRSLGFDARRIAGCIVMEEYPGTNHGSVVANLGGVDYLVDGNLGAFEVLPLQPASATAAGPGIHRVTATPSETGFDVDWYQSFRREEPLTFRTELQHDPVNHAFFLERYDLTKKLSVFNDALFICRRSYDSMLTLGSDSMVTLSADNVLTSTEVEQLERKAILVETFGISEQMADALPPDVPDGKKLLLSRSRRVASHPCFHPLCSSAFSPGSASTCGPTSTSQV